VLMRGDRAAFYRVIQANGVSQIALVLLNKGDVPTSFDVHEALQAGHWRNALDGGGIDVASGAGLSAQVPAHGVAVYLLDAPVHEPALVAALDRAAVAGGSAGAAGPAHHQ